MLMDLYSLLPPSLSLLVPTIDLALTSILPRRSQGVEWYSKHGRRGRKENIVCCEVETSEVSLSREDEWHLRRAVARLGPLIRTRGNGPDQDDGERSGRH